MRIRYPFSNTVGLELVKKEIIFCEIDEVNSVSCRAHVVLVPANNNYLQNKYVDKDFKLKLVPGPWPGSHS